MENAAYVKLLMIIVNAGFADHVVETARSAGAKGATIINARGAGAPQSFLGITVDTEKEIILSVVEADVAERVMEAIKEKAGIKTPARSVCFTMPVEKTLGINMPQSQIEDEA